jgi:hypothetical protein
MLAVREHRAKRALAQIPVKSSADSIPPRNRTMHVRYGRREAESSAMLAAVSAAAALRAAA